MEKKEYIFKIIMKFNFSNQINKDKMPLGFGRIKTKINTQTIYSFIRNYN